jgi:hypothetical protein
MYRPKEEFTYGICKRHPELIEKMKEHRARQLPQVIYTGKRYRIRETWPGRCVLERKTQVGWHRIDSGTRAEMFKLACVPDQG